MGDKYIHKWFMFYSFTNVLKDIPHNSSCKSLSTKQVCFAKSICSNLLGKLTLHLFLGFLQLQALNISKLKHRPEISV